jgi:hypothetical protein
LPHIARLDGHQLASVAVGQAAQRHRIHHGEYIGVATDPESQRDGCYSDEGRVPADEPSGIPQIVPPPRRNSAM